VSFCTTSKSLRSRMRTATIAVSLVGSVMDVARRVSSEAEVGCRQLLQNQLAFPPLPYPTFGIKISLMHECMHSPLNSQGLTCTSPMFISASALDAAHQVAGAAALRAARTAAAAATASGGRTASSSSMCRIAASAAAGEACASGRIVRPLIVTTCAPARCYSGHGRLAHQVST